MVPVNLLQMTPEAVLAVFHAHHIAYNVGMREMQDVIPLPKTYQNAASAEAYFVLDTGLEGR
jgi:hypothetical protein